MVPLVVAGIGAGISGLASLAKGIFGASQASKASKALKKMKSPTYNRPEEYQDLMDLYRQQAGMSQLPGQQAYESRMGAGVAESVSDLQKSASSSATAQSSLVDIYGKKQDAIRDLAVQFAEYKTARQRDLAKGLEQGADYSDKEFEVNKWLPYQTKMNELTGQRQAGAANLWGGIEGMASAGMNLMGTASYLNVLEGMRPQYGSGVPAPTGGYTGGYMAPLQQSPFTTKFATPPLPFDPRKLDINKATV